MEYPLWEKASFKAFRNKGFYILKKLEFFLELHQSPFLNTL